jgi:metallophosphoesterase superfamily enzyme
VFLVTPNCLVLPAFSPFARGYDVAAGLPPALEACFCRAPIQAYVATPTRVLPLGSLDTAMERLAEADASPPSRFRRFLGR